MPVVTTNSVDCKIAGKMISIEEAQSNFKLAGIFSVNIQMKTCQISCDLSCFRTGGGNEKTLVREAKKV